MSNGRKELINGTTDDDRVVPSHSFKLAATLQHVRADNPHPLLIRVDKKSGHGAGKSTKKRYVSTLVSGDFLSDDGSRIEEAADKYSFVALSLGLEWKGAVPSEDAGSTEK